MSNWLKDFLFGREKEAPKDTAANRDTVVPEFLKTAAYTSGETMEETIEKDWKKLIINLSDFVLAEQIAERELQGMGYPEKMAEHFQKTLKECKKNRKKAEERLYKLIPRHSQLDCREFFDRVREQSLKEAEAKARAIEYYPPAGIPENKGKGIEKEAYESEEELGETIRREEKIEELEDALAHLDKVRESVRKDYGDESDVTWERNYAGRYKRLEEQLAKLKGIKKEAGKEMGPGIPDGTGPVWGGPPMSGPRGRGRGRPQEDGEGATLKPGTYHCFCPVCKKTYETKMEKCPDCGKTIVEDIQSVKKEAAAKWKPGQELEAKHDCCVRALVVYVNEEDKTYTVKVDGVMLPSYYAYEDCYETFVKRSPEDSKNAPDAKARGVSKEAGGNSTDTSSDVVSVTADDRSGEVPSNGKGKKEVQAPPKEEAEAFEGGVVPLCDTCGKPAPFKRDNKNFCAKCLGSVMKLTYILRAQDEKGFWQEVRRSTFLPDLQIKADQLSKDYPDRKIVIDAVREAKWQERTSIWKKDTKTVGAFNIARINEDLGFYFITGPGLRYPTPFTFEDAHELFTEQPKEYLEIREPKAESSLNKKIEKYQLQLHEDGISLKSGDFSTKWMISSTEEACKEFLKLESAEAVEEAFALEAINNLETEADGYVDRATLDKYVEMYKEGQITEVQLKEQGFTDELIDRIKRQAEAETSAEKPLPGNVPGEMSPGVGAANPEGTSVWTEPRGQGDQNVMQKEAGELLGPGIPDGTGPGGKMVLEPHEGHEPHDELPGGRADNLTVEDVAKKHSVPVEEVSKQLEIGLEVEKEHTPDVTKQREIALDHLVENPFYYQESPGAEKDLLVVPMEKKAEDEGISAVCAEGAHERCTMRGCKCFCHEEPPSGIKPGIEKEAKVCPKCGKPEHMHETRGTDHGVEWVCEKCKAPEHMEVGELTPSLSKEAKPGRIAILNDRVGSLSEGSEVGIIAVEGDIVGFYSVANSKITGITKLSKLDFPSIKREAADFEKEKYQWDNDGMKEAFDLGESVKVSKSIKYDGHDLKGKEGVVREKVIMTPADNKKREMYYLVEFEGMDKCHPVTVPGEALSKGRKEEPVAWRTAGLNPTELNITKHAVTKPNIDVVNDYIKTFKDVPPTVLSDTMINEFLRRENYSVTREDLKEIYSLLQSNGIEVRITISEKEKPQMTEEEMIEPTETPETPAVEKEAVKYESVTEKPGGGKVTEETEELPEEVAEVAGEEFEKADPATGLPKKWKKKI